MNVYEIFTKITMQNAASGVMAVLAKEVLGLEGGILKLNKAFSEMGRTSWAMLGGLGIAGGGGIIYGLKSAADHAKELSHQLSNIQKLGMTSAQVSAATGAAYALPGQVPGMTSASALAILNNINSIIGPEGARKMLGPLAQFGQAMGAQTGNYEGANQSILKLVRSADLLGKFVNATTHQVDLTKLQSFLDLVAKVSAATHGMVKEETWLAMAQQGGPALSGMSDEGLMSMAMAAQAMGGFRVGTAMTSLYQQMIGGTMKPLIAKNLQDLGLVGHHKASRGGGVIWSQGALDSPFAEALKHDPLAAEVILRKALEAHGYRTIEQQIPELFKILGRQTTQRLIHDFLRNEPQMFGERGRMMKGAGVVGQIDIANAQDYERNTYILSQAWAEMMAQIGLPITRVAIEQMKKLTSVFLQIAEIAKAHPDAIANIATGLGILGVSLMGAGAIAIIAALGPVGWLAGGITALGVAFLAYKNPILAWLESMRITNWNKIITEALTPIVTGLKQWFSDLPGKVADAMKGMWENFKHELGISYTGEGFGPGGMYQHASLGGGGGVGGSVGRALGGMGGDGGSGPGIAARGTLKTNQNEAYAAAIAAGLSPTAAQSLVANMSGESLANPANKHWDVHHFSQGIVQWDDVRSAAINRQFGKFPKDMSVTEQVNAAIWEMKTKYTKTWGILQSGASAQEMMNSLVRDYELPADKAGAIAQRMRYFRGLQSNLAGPPLPHVESHHKKEREAPIQNIMFLDGEVVHRSVVKRMVRAMTHPTTAPYHDGSRHFTSPDSGLVGV